MKIVLAVEELNGIHGGVERTVVNLANYLQAQGHQTVIMTFEPENSGNPCYELAGGVERCYLGLITGSGAQSTGMRDKLKQNLPHFIYEAIRNVLALKRIWTVRRHEIPHVAKALQALQADVVVSFKTHFHRYIVPAACESGTPVIASDHNPPEQLYYHYVCAVDRLVIWHWLKKADAVRLLQAGFKNGYPAEVSKKCVAIPNGIQLPEKRAKPGEGERFVILSIGRLYFQKDLPTLIRAFALLAGQYPDWSVRMYGDGPEEAALQALIAELGLSGRVFLEGPEPDVMPLYRQAHIYALPSLFEGFGNVTLEALASGLPVVGFKEILANETLIEDGQNGLLVSPQDRINSFAQGLEHLMRAPGLRAEMGRKAAESSRRFEINAVMGQWEQLMQELSGDSRSEAALKAAS